MKIGYFTSIEGWGGSESYLKSVMTGVRARGHKVVLFGIEGTRLFEEMKKIGIECVSWRRSNAKSVCSDMETGSCKAKFNLSNRRDINSIVAIKKLILKIFPMWFKLLLGNIKEVLWLTSLFKKHRVDLMHINIHGYEVAGIACKFCGIPSLGMFHITELDRHWFRWILVQQTAIRYDHILSPSKWCTDLWVKKTGIDPAKASYVWNGIDLDRFHAEHIGKKRTKDDRFRLITGGRLHEMKGYKYLIEALKILDDKRVLLDIFGSGEEECKLKELTNRLGLENMIVFHGHVENLEHYMKHADCFVFPSISHEAMPLALVEAMALGLPVITSDFGPLPEININSITGIVVSMKDSQALAEAIKCLMEDPDMCFKMGLAGQERARKNFSEDEMIQNMVQLYAKFCKKNDKDCT